MTHDGQSGFARGHAGPHRRAPMPQASSRPRLVASPRIIRQIFALGVTLFEEKQAQRSPWISWSDRPRRLPRRGARGRRRRRAAVARRPLTGRHQPASLKGQARQMIAHSRRRPAASDRSRRTSLEDRPDRAPCSSGHRSPARSARWADTCVRAGRCGRALELPSRSPPQSPVPSRVLGWDICLRPVASRAACGSCLALSHALSLGPPCRRRGGGGGGGCCRGGGWRLAAAGGANTSARPAGSRRGRRAAVRPRSARIASRQASGRSLTAQPALQQVQLQVEAQHDVEIVGHLVGVGADQRALDLVDGAVERVERHVLRAGPERLAQRG